MGNVRIGMIGVGQIGKMHVNKYKDVADAEMFRVFNMGIGFVLVVAPFYSRSIMAHLRRAGQTPYFLGKVRKGDGEVVIK